MNPVFNLIILLGLFISRKLNLLRTLESDVTLLSENSYV